MSSQTRRTYAAGRRTRDINLRIAIGERPGTQTMSIVVDTGLSTLDETIAQKHASAGRTVEKQEVKQPPLQPYGKSVPEGQVHFLKSMPGSEEALKREHWSKYRPDCHR